MKEKPKNNIKRSLYGQYQNLKKIIKRALMMSDPSQAGEVSVLRRLFGKDHVGYLVDIGAHDGQSFSNSSVFINLGWQAIFIEPLPGPFNRLVEKYKSNPKVRCLNIAISDSKGVQELFIGNDGPEGMLSTLCRDENNWFASTRNKESIRVQVDNLTNVLLEYQYPKDFSLLLIDTEGMDYECLLGIDFDLFSPQVIVTETYMWNPEKHAKKEELLCQKGYKHYKNVGCNTIWVQQ